MNKKTYTAEEVVDIVQRALGLKAAPTAKVRKDENYCEDCGRADLRESRDGRLYCYACYVDGKKEKGTWKEGGGR